MQSKLCSHNLQSDYQGSSQRICLLIMRITSYTKDRRFFEKEQNHGGRRRDTFSSNFCRYHNFYRKVTSLQVEEHRFSIPELVSLPPPVPPPGCSLPSTILLVQSIAAARAGVTQALRPMINMMYLEKPADKMNYQLEGITVLSYSSFAPLTGRGWISSLAVAGWSRRTFWLNAHSRILLRKLKIYLQYVLSLHFISSKVMSFRLTQQHNYERDCLRKAREAYLIHTAKTIKPLSSHTLPCHTM